MKTQAHKILLEGIENAQALEISAQLQAIGYSDVEISNDHKNALRGAPNTNIKLIIMGIGRENRLTCAGLRAYASRCASIPVVFIIEACHEAIMAEENWRHYIVEGEYNVPLLRAVVNSAIRENELEQRMCDVAGHMNEASFTIGHNGLIVQMNPRFERIMGLDRRDILGKNIWGFYKQKLTINFYAQLYNVLDSNAETAFEDYIPCLQQWFSVRIVVAKGGLCAYMADITAQKKLEQEVARQDKQLREIAWIQSHKVRNPVTIIMGLAGLFVNKTPSDNENTFIIDGIREAADELDRVTREINQKTQREGARVKKPGYVKQAAKTLLYAPCSH